MAKTKQKNDNAKLTDFTINGTYAAGIRFNDENVTSIVLDTEDPAAASVTVLVTNEKTGKKYTGYTILDEME